MNISWEIVSLSPPTFRIWWHDSRLGRKYGEIWQKRANGTWLHIGHPFDKLTKDQQHLLDLLAKEVNNDGIKD